LGDIRCRLSRILGDRRITQRKLAKKSGLSTYTINKFYNEKWQGVDRETMIKLCETLGVQVGDLFEYVEIEEVKKAKEKSKKGGK
jgi:putative transcriptional regulator